jgi:AAA+ ATPase superfamily predicted ATPase
MLQEPTLIGRKKEIEVLKRVRESYKSEFLILYGRRRVGKSCRLTVNEEAMPPLKVEIHP